MSRKLSYITKVEEKVLKNKIVKMNGYNSKMNSFAKRLDRVEIQLNILKRENNMMRRIIENIKKSKKRR